MVDKMMQIVILILIKKMKEHEGQIRKKKCPQAQFDLQIKHILPKANQIVKTAQQNIKSLYPYDVVPSAPSRCFANNIPSITYEACSKINKIKFIPPKLTVSDHFDRKNIIYDSFNLYSHSSSYPINIFSIDRLKSLSKNDFILNVEKMPPFVSAGCNLEFDSRFQCGNLSVAAYTNGVYCLLLHNDVNTTGYTNWYYFSATSKEACNAKIAIMNYGKAGWPQNMFPGVCVWIEQQNKWTRYSGIVQCEANSNLYSKGEQFQKFNTLYFQFNFKENQKVYFAYSPPYAYTDLLQLLDSIDEKKHTYFHRKLAGTTLIGNRLEMITITNFEKIKQAESNLPVIVLLARTHAGETVSSWIMHNIITFLTSNDQIAQALRNNFVFKIFPMVNPDGVIHGNYRCSLIGRDLNRRWKNPSKQYFPQIYFIKNQIIDTFQKRPIKMVLDFHGHTQKRKAFFYGCNDKTAPYKTRLFPYLTTKISSNFQFSSCNFSMDKSKQSTARITLYNLIKSPEIFTIQTSQFGMIDKFLSTQSFNDIALTVCKAIYRFYKLHKIANPRLNTANLNSLSANNTTGMIPCNDSNQCQEDDDYQAQILGNPMLLKVGCQPSDGSDSEPSICNMNFDKINKMVVNLQTTRPASENGSNKKKPVVPRPQSYNINKANFKNLQSNYIFSTDNSRQISERPEISPSVPLRGSTTMGQRRQKQKIKIRTPKPQYNKQVPSSTKFRQLTVDVQKKPLRMINFQLLIEQSSKRRSSMRQEGFQFVDIKTNHPNFHMFQKRCMFRNRSYNWNKNSV